MTRHIKLPGETRVAWREDPLQISPELILTSRDAIGWLNSFALVRYHILVLSNPFMAVHLLHIVSMDNKVIFATGKGGSESLPLEPR